jgi:hypothetical protein
MIRRTAATKNRNYYVHPLIALQYIHDISYKLFALLKPTFLNLFSDNMCYDKYENFCFPEVKKIAMKIVDEVITREKTVADMLALSLGGEREYSVTGGRIDLLTQDEIIEVKTYHKRLIAVGQVLMYKEKMGMNYKPRIHLFDHHDKRDSRFESMCCKIGVKVTYN